MNKYTFFLLLMIIMSLLLSSCNKETVLSPETSKNLEDAKSRTFVIQNNISQISIYSYEEERHLTAIIRNKEDIDSLVSILNLNTSVVEPHTLELYRELEVIMNDSSILIIKFVNNPTFVVENIGEFSLTPSNNFNKLKNLIDVFEKEYLSSN